jgi:hypothetical protein
MIALLSSGGVPVLMVRACRAPDLVATVPMRIQRSRTVAQTFDENVWCRDIQGMLTMQVLVQYIHVGQRIQGFTPTPGVDDHFLWRWSPTGAYYSASPYDTLFICQTTLRGAKELWKV